MLFQRKTEALVFFLNPLTIRSLYKRKSVLCPFVDKETNGRYPFSNGLNGLVHLCLQDKIDAKSLSIEVIQKKFFLEIPIRSAQSAFEKR